MTVKTVVDNVTRELGFGLPDEVVIDFDLGEVLNIKYLSISALVSSPIYHMYYASYYSYDNTTWVQLINTIADNAPLLRNWASLLVAEGSTQHVYIKLVKGSLGVPDALSHYDDITVSVNDLVVDSILLESVTTDLQLSPTFNGHTFIPDEIFMSFPHITTQVESGGGGELPDPDPTSTNLITGNVKKLGLPFKANVVAVSLGVNPKVVGETVSDELTGDYVIDIYPHPDEVLLYVAPDYGRAFSPSLSLTQGQTLHPSIPNQFVYVAQNSGIIGLIEPNWGAGEITSNEVTLLAVPLHRPLMNGFVKPSIIAI